MNTRPILLGLLAASLALPALAQKVTKPIRPSTQVTEEELEAVSKDPRFAEQRARFDEEMGRDMLQMRENLEREALNRMNNRRYDQPSNHWENLLEKFMAFMVFVIMLSALLWLFKVIMNNRRWSRVASIQTDIHNKLLEKMATHQELLTYMETEAGKRFLESSPFEVEQPQQSPLFPYGRILLSAQAGVVLLVTGVGLLWLQERLPEEAQPLLFFGILLMAPGFGLMVSAFLSYIFSRHMGLIPENQK